MIDIGFYFLSAHRVRGGINDILTPRLYSIPFTHFISSHFDRYCLRCTGRGGDCCTNDIIIMHTAIYCTRVSRLQRVHTPLFIHSNLLVSRVPRTFPVYIYSRRGVRRPPMIHQKLCSRARDKHGNRSRLFTSSVLLLFADASRMSSPAN